jgi:Rrf2 family iron-sulfur cluster assembly transcriptional regulator
MKQRNLVSSLPGAKGGYVLSRAISEISLYDIIESVEDMETESDCSKRENSEYCIGKPCGFHQVWSEINDHMKEYYSGISLEYISKKIKEQ